MRSLLLGLGLAAYPSTQLRVQGLPLGPGEALLVAWLCLAVLTHLMAGAIRPNRALVRISAFWAIVALALCAGAFVGLAREPYHYWSGILHDMSAYMLLCALAVMMAIDLADPRRRAVAVWSLACFSAASMLLQIAHGFGLSVMPGVDPWFFDRLRGWSMDPNQLGFFCVVTVMLGLHLAETASRPSRALAALGIVAIAGAAGFLTRSDTFVVALLASSAVYVVLKSANWLRTVQMGPTLRGATVVLGLLALPLAAASAAPFWSAAVERVQHRSAEVYADDGQGELRLHLWTEAIEKGAEAGLLGYGPGPHLTSKSWKRPPPYKFEAHNTSLDLFTQGGVVATAAFLWLCASAFIAAWRDGRPALAALTLSLAMFSMFHFVVRHPLFWIGIALCLLETQRRARARPAEVAP
ncbi:MAG: O-antigen ligase family protein [Pseudomonadota bacterium]